MSDASPTASNRIQLLVLERIDEEKNMARYYVLSIEQTLFGEPALIREWGRIGSSGRHRIDVHGAEEEAREALGAWLARKLRRGYVPREAKAS
jgi:predicted DNA-binding WGR domain protein